MRKTAKTFSFFAAGASGIVAANLFLRLYGIVSAYLTDVGAISWINLLPKSLSKLAFWLHYFFFEMFVLLIVILTIGSIIGFFLRINKLIASIIAFSLYLITKSYYIYSIHDELSYVFSPVVYFAIISTSTFLLFWIGFYFGELIHKKFR